MEKTNFWKDVAKYGAIIGALLAVSFMLETRLQISASFGLYAIEWIAVVVLHYYLLHRFTRRYSMMYTAEEGFSFGQGYAYILSVSCNTFTCTFSSVTPTIRSVPQPHYPIL